MQISPKKIVDRRAVGDNIWLRFSEARSGIAVYDKAFDFTVLETEDAVGQAMFDELEACAGRKTEDIVIVILGGRGAQAFHRILGEKARGFVKRHVSIYRNWSMIIPTVLSAIRH